MRKGLRIEAWKCEEKAVKVEEGKKERCKCFEWVKKKAEIMVKGKNERGMGNEGKGCR